MHSSLSHRMLGEPTQPHVANTDEARKGLPLRLQVV